MRASQDTRSLDTLEQRLLQGYQEHGKHYDRALLILNAQGSKAPANPEWVQDLHSVLMEIQAADADLADAKAAWRQTGRSPGPELASLLARLKNQNAMLAQGVNRHMHDIETRKARLLPEIDGLIQQRRMLEAYGKYGDRQPHVA